MALVGGIQALALRCRQGDHPRSIGIESVVDDGLQERHGGEDISAYGINIGSKNAG